MQDSEPSLDLVHPRRTCGGEVESKAFIPLQPIFDLLMFVRRIVIQDNMNFFTRRNVLFYLFKETQKLLVAMLAVTFSNNVPMNRVEGSEKCGCAMSFVVMSPSLDLMRLHWKKWLRSVQSLNTTLFINTKHNRILRWIKVRIPVMADSVSI